MKKSAILLIPILSLIAALAVPQSGRVGMPAPPPSLDPKPTGQEEPHVSRRFDPLELQREADDLSRMAQTIPTDVASVRKGMLPKDVILKLKQIEKLSKHLRSTLAP